METSLLPWMIYILVSILLTVLAFAHATNTSHRLNDTKTNLDRYLTPSVDEDKKAEQELIRKRTIRSTYPFLCVLPVWTMWILNYTVDKDSVITDDFFVAAVVVTLICLVLYLRSFWIVRKLIRSHVGPQRH